MIIFCTFFNAIAQEQQLDWCAEAYNLKVIILVLHHFQQVSLFYSLMGRFRKKKSFLQIEIYVAFSHIHYTKF